MSDDCAGPIDRSRNKWLDVATRWGRLFAGAAVAVFGISEVRGGVWPAVLLTPYTPQWAAIGLIGAGLLAVTELRHHADRRPRRIDVILLFTGLLAAGWGGAVTLGLVPWRTLPPTPRVSPADATGNATGIADADVGLGRIKVLAANVHSSNKDHRTLLDLIAAEDPDIILLTEINDDWLRDLRPLNARYPTRRSVPDATGNFGISVFSRLPATDAAFTLMKDEEPDTLLDVPQFDATFAFTGTDGRSRPIRFVGLHPLTPLKPTKTVARDTVLSRTAASVAARPGVPTIVAGDFNATRYCHAVRVFDTAAHLTDAASHLRFSWPNTWSWWAMGIRIDHVLVSRHWRTVDVRHGRDIGSDHLPLVATLQLVSD